MAKLVRCWHWHTVCVTLLEWTLHPKWDQPPDINFSECSQNTHVGLNTLFFCKSSKTFTNTSWFKHEDVTWRHTRVGKVLGAKVLGVRFRRIIPPRLNYVAGLQGEKPPLTSIKDTILLSPCRPTYSASSGLPNKDSVVSLYGRALLNVNFFHAIKRPKLLRLHDIVLNISKKLTEVKFKAVSGNKRRYIPE